MERSEILDMMTALQLAGMRAAYDEIVTSGVKRQQGVEKVIGALLKAEIAAKQARSINYQMGVAKLPLAKELNDLDFTGTPINDELIAHLATGAFLEEKRNVVLVGGTGTGKRHRHHQERDPGGPQGALLQCRRPRQQARDRDQARACGAHGRCADTGQPRDPR
jgi:hypothetical protein